MTINIFIVILVLISNLLISAAIGCVQLSHDLPSFRFASEKLELFAFAPHELSDFLDFSLPTHASSWSHNFWLSLDFLMPLSLRLGLVFLFP